MVPVIKASFLWFHLSYEVYVHPSFLCDEFSNNSFFLFPGVWVWGCVCCLDEVFALMTSWEQFIKSKTSSIAFPTRQYMHVYYVHIDTMMSLNNTIYSSFSPMSRCVLNTSTAKFSLLWKTKLLRSHMCCFHSVINTLSCSLQACS